MAKNKLIAPFLKWVGGKRQLIPDISKHLPSPYTKYYEPFIGGGAILFHLQPKKAVINDFNGELINVYNVIKDNLDALIKDLKSHENNAEYFYEIRSVDRDKKFSKLTNIQRASRIIYLNKTCFNGLYRVNNSGEFNSPFGRYANPNIVNDVTLKAVSKYLNENEITILNGDYEQSLNGIRRNAFVYFDPPYHPVSQSSNFTGYTQGGFGIKEQERLRDVCIDLNERGVKFLLSNSATDFIKDLYSDFNIHIVKANRSINSDSDKRGEVDEFLICNYE